MENQPATKKCPSCQKGVSFDITKCPYCGKDFRSWFRRHLILTILLGLLILPSIFSVIVSDTKQTGNTINKSEERPDKSYAPYRQEKNSSQEIADSILVEQKARADEVQSKVVTLLESERCQEAKDLLLRRQEEIVTIMLGIRANENLSDGDKGRILEPLAVESESRANQVGTIVGFEQDELLRSLE